MESAASTSASPRPSTSAGPSGIPRLVRLSRGALAARAYAKKVTKMPLTFWRRAFHPSYEPKPVILVRPPSRVARARISFPDAKYTIVREAVMPEKVPSKIYYHLMGKSLINLKDILNKTYNLKINSPSPCIPRKRRSCGVAGSSKTFDKPSKKAKKIII